MQLKNKLHASEIIWSHAIDAGREFLIALQSNKSPAQEPMPGAHREFQFRECADLRGAVKPVGQHEIVPRSRLRAPLRIAIDAASNSGTA